ncbi:MAG TPA: YraN family protein [Kofleriaceae bacterium]|nr:YraN family protein [Kofleriaceae bacterium]
MRPPAPADPEAGAAAPPTAADDIDGRTAEPTNPAVRADSTVAKGRGGEDRAEAFLRARGYEIVERNARSPVGEIDLVAREGGDLVFVEVRSRADDSSGGAEETVGAIKQRQLGRAAAAYLAERALAFDTCRFDVVAITGDDIALFQDAFRLSGESGSRY